MCGHISSSMWKHTHILVYSRSSRWGETLRTHVVHNVRRHIYSSIWMTCIWRSPQLPQPPRYMDDMHHDSKPQSALTIPSLKTSSSRFKTSKSSSTSDSSISSHSSPRSSNVFLAKRTSWLIHYQPEVDTMDMELNWFPHDSTRTLSPMSHSH